MKNAILVAACLFLPFSVHAHDPGEERIVIEAESDQPITANSTTYEFQLVDTEKNKVVTDADLVISHEKKLHFLVYDPALREFQHVHPEFNGRVWTVDLKFAVSGNYWMWAQGKLADGTEFSVSTRAPVALSLPAWPAPPRLSDVRAGGDGISVATLSAQRLVANRSAMLKVVFTRSDGSAAEITPYLGAFAHVLTAADDGDTLIHVHPMNGPRPNEGILHVSFPRAGFYRIWVQFLDASQLKTVALSVQVF